MWLQAKTDLGARTIASMALTEVSEAVAHGTKDAFVVAVDAAVDGDPGPTQAERMRNLRSELAELRTATPPKRRPDQQYKIQASSPEPASKAAEMAKKEPGQMRLGCSFND